jgi:hypothetical protein
MSDIFNTSQPGVAPKYSPPALDRGALIRILDDYKADILEGVRRILDEKLNPKPAPATNKKG